MKKTTFFIVGKHAVVEALKNANRRVEKVFLTEEAKKNINREYQNINLFKNVSIIYKSKRELDNICGNRDISHQGLIAEAENLETETLKDYIEENDKKNLNLIALEEVTDPRNIGSIIRSAVSFHINGIIVKDRSFPSKSKLLFKSASGGVEHIKIFKVANINSSLKLLKSYNFWISAFDGAAKKDFTQHDWTGRNVLLFGSEGYGLRKKTLDKSDFLFKININKNMESLNISNSVSIVCHFIDFQTKGGKKKT